MDLQQLRYIHYLAEELHFGRAAKRAHVTQPTLSQQIKRLEEELGESLFERSAHHVHLTEAGKKFLPRVKNILNDLQDAIGEIQDESEEIKGTVKIAAIPTMAPYLLPQLIVKIKREAPQLNLEVYEETTAVLLEYLKSGKVDLGVLALPTLETGVLEKEISSEPFYLVVSKKHTLSKRKEVSKKDLEDEKMMILKEGHCFADQSLEYCERTRDDEKIHFQGSSLTSVIRLAETGEGVTLIPNMARKSLKSSNVVFIPFTNPKPERKIGLVWRVSTPLTKAHRFTMEKLKEVIHGTR